MKGLFQDIYTIYAAQAEILDCFADLSRKKSELIKQNDTARLDQMIKAEEALLMKFSFMEQKRQKALEMFRNEKNIQGNIDADTLDQYLNKEEQQKFDALRERFSAAIEEQRKTNDLNKRMLNTKATYMDYILNVIDNKQNGAAVAPKSIIDKRV